MNVFCSVGQVEETWEEAPVAISAVLVCIRVLRVEVPLLTLDVLVVLFVPSVDVAEVVFGRVLRTHFKNILFFKTDAFVIEILKVDKVELVFSLNVVWLEGNFFILCPRLVIHAIAELECKVFLIVLLIPHKAVDGDTCPGNELQSIVVVCAGLRVRLILALLGSAPQNRLLAIAFCR